MSHRAIAAPQDMLIPVVHADEEFNMNTVPVTWSE